MVRFLIKSIEAHSPHRCPFHWKSKLQIVQLGLCIKTTGYSCIHSLEAEGFSDSAYVYVYVTLSHRLLSRSRLRSTATATFNNKKKRTNTMAMVLNGLVETNNLNTSTCVCCSPETKFILSSHFAIYRNIYNDKTVLQDEIHTSNEWSGSNANGISTRQNKKEADSVSTCVL